MTALHIILHSLKIFFIPQLKTLQPTSNQYVVGCAKESYNTYARTHLHFCRDSNLVLWVNSACFSTSVTTVIWQLPPTAAADIAILHARASRQMALGERRPRVTGSFIQQRHTISKVGPTNCGCLASSNSSSSLIQLEASVHLLSTVTSRRCACGARCAACVPRGAVKADSIAVLRSSHFDEVKRSTSFAIKFKKVIAIESVRKARSLCATISYFSSCMQSAMNIYRVILTWDLKFGFSSGQTVNVH